MTDPELIAGILAGEAGYFHTLFMRYEKLAYGIAWKYLNQEADVHDATQAAWCRVYTKLNTLKNAKQFKTWFYSIVANECLMLLRKTYRKKEVFFTDIRKLLCHEANEDEYLDDLMKTDDPTKELEDRERVRLATKALAHIKEEHQLPLFLHGWLNIKNEDIGVIINRTTEGAKSRIYRGRRELRDIMER